MLSWFPTHVHDAAMLRARVARFDGDASRRRHLGVRQQLACVEVALTRAVRLLVRAMLDVDVQPLRASGSSDVRERP